MHWVGDGFPVRQLFSHQEHGARCQPLSLARLRRADRFPPSEHRRGVGAHPHRGFETVTIVLDGEVAHRDSTGAGGLIGPGDVQWMTAASGVLHEEYPFRRFHARRGGRLEDVAALGQPAGASEDVGRRATRPCSTPRSRASICRTRAAGARDRRRVQRRDADRRRRRRRSNIWDVRIDEGKAAVFRLPEGHNLIVVVVDGPIVVNGQGHLRSGETVVFERHGGEISLAAQADAKLLLLSGEPIDEPVVQEGPFAMNSEAEIREAVEDYRSGKFGTIAPAGA